MQERATVHAVAGVGLEGDRYATGRGYWSYEPRYVSEITFVDIAVLERVARELGRPLDPGEYRRNVVLHGADVAGLIGQRFSIGDAEFEGERPCDPCAYIDRLLAAPVQVALADGGGLRARVVRSGSFAAGDRLGGATQVASPSSHDIR